MTIKQSVDSDVLGAFCTFWIISLLLTSLLFCANSAFGYPFIKIVSAIPYGLHAGIALEAFDHFRKGGGVDDATLWEFSTSQGLHGIAGIFMFVWSLFQSCMFTTKDFSSRKLKAEDWKTDKKSRGFFYLILIELFFLACLIMAIAFGYHDVPMGYAGCRKARLEGTTMAHISWVSDIWPRMMCNRAVTVQITGIMSAILLSIQTLVIIPVAAWPRTVRYIIYMIFAKRSPAKNAPNHEKWDEAYDLESLYSASSKISTDSRRPPRLHEVFASDRIARNVASHLHFIDITNLSHSSRVMRYTIRHGPGSGVNDPQQRIQMFYETACVGGDKAECWACARMICKTCRHERKLVPTPRTQSHAASCFAVCTKCYLLRAPARPAPFEATKNTHDLSLQHYDSCKAKSAEPLPSVMACRSCAHDTIDEMSRTREGRDTESLRRSQAGRLWCAECQKSLGKGRRRWFICEQGSHECHWQGHQQ